MDTKGIRAALDKLGSTSEEVAEKLKEKGVKGARRSVGTCPIAIYLWREGFKWENGVGTMIVGGSCISDNPRADLMATPGVVADFIRDFDRGNYPELEER